MQFNDVTTKLGICQEIDSLCDSTSTSFPVADKTRRVNSALEEIVGELINSDGTAQFDDSNYTDFPIGTYTMVEGQAKYSFNDKFLQLINVQVKNANGDFQIVRPIDQAELDTNIPLEEMYETSGMPLFYDKLSDDTIKLYPAPTSTQVTLTSGLKLYFKRTGSLFTASDTTKEPGFASPFHILLAYMAAIPYCATYKKDRVALYEKKVAELKKALIKHYSHVEKDKRKRATTKPIIFR